jgi:hypothetical protein
MYRVSMLVVDKKYDVVLLRMEYGVGLLTKHGRRIDNGDCWGRSAIWMGEPLVDAREHSGHSWRRQVGQWKNETTGDGQGRLLSTTPGRDACSQPKGKKVCACVLVCVYDCVW